MEKDKEPKTRQERKGKGKFAGNGKEVYNQKSIRIKEAMMEKAKEKAKETAGV